MSLLKRWITSTAIKVLYWSLNRSSFDGDTLKITEDDSIMRGIIESQHNRSHNLLSRFKLVFGNYSHK